MHELAVSLTDSTRLEVLGASRDFRALSGVIAPSEGDWLPLVRVLGESAVTRVYLGNEFCENLIPSPERLRRALLRARELGLLPSLLTPMVTDQGIARLARILPLFCPETEVIANDWGVVRLLRTRFPRLRPVAGRLLAKQLKDPRLASPEWARLVPHGLFAPSFRELLQELEVRRMEIDLPPHFDPATLPCLDVQVTVHAPYGYCSKGRICRIGSLSLPPSSKFAPGHACRRECLTYVARMERRAGASDLPTFQRGNTLFYRYSEEMIVSLERLLGEGGVDRIVVSGDWNEGRSAA